MSNKLKDAIGYDYKANEFVIGSHDAKGNAIKASDQNYTVADVDAMLREMASGGGNLMAQHELLAETIIEPIMQVVEYVEMFFPTFFSPRTVGVQEDPRIAVEDLPVLAWQTTDDAAVLYTRAGLSFARPSFVRFDTGIEVNWYDLERAGWDYLSRQMKYAAWELARKRDGLARGVLQAGLLASRIYNITGGLLTKASVDAVLKTQAAAGFPVRTALINPATMMDMATFAWTANSGFFQPSEMALDMVRTLTISNYGGLNWQSNVNLPTNEVWLGGAPSEIGYHITRGSVKRASDVDITNKRDIHVIIDQEHSGYIGSSLAIAKIFIGA